MNDPSGVSITDQGFVSTKSFEKGTPREAAVARRISGTLRATWAIQGLGLINGAIVARLLGVHDRGLLAAVILAPTIVAYLGDLGGPNAYVFLSSRGPKSVGALIGNAAALALVQGTFLFFFGLPLVLLILHRYEAWIGSSLIFMGLYLPLNLFTRYLNAINQGLGRFTTFNAVRVSVLVSYVAGAIGLVILGFGRVQAIIAVILLSNVVACGMAARQLLVPHWSEISLNRGLLWETFRFGLRSHLGNLTPVDSMQLDLMVVVALLGPHQAGLYAVAASGGMIVRGQGTALGLVAFPAVAAASSDAAKRFLTTATFRLGLIMNAVTAVVIASFATLLVPVVYGKAFGDAVPILTVLVWGMVAASLRQLLGDCIRGFGKPLHATIAEIASWLVAAAALITLVPKLGAVGAAVAVSVSYMASLAILVFACTRLEIAPAQLFTFGRSDLRFGSELVKGILRGVRPVSRGAA